jgi:hypothetical protein
MATNTVETVWKLSLDEQTAKKSESILQRLANTVKKALGEDSTRAVQKTTEAIKDQTKALEANEKAAKESGSSLSATEGISKGFGGAGRAAGLANLAGAGAGEGLSILGDTADAVEGLTEVGSVIAGLGPVGLVAAGAVGVLALVVGDFAESAREAAEQIDAAFNAARSVADEIAGGATTEDVQASIDQLQFRREMEQEILAEATASYEQFVQGIRDAFGALAPLVEGILKIIDPREEALHTQIETSNKLITESEAKERAYNEALEKGLTSKADAKQAEEERQKAQEEADRKAKQEAEKAAREREAAAKKAQAEAEQFAKQMEAIDQQRFKAAQKYSDALVDIARKSADDAIKASKALREKQTDNQRGFNQDISDMTRDFHASELEEAIKRQDEEAATLRQHVLKLEGIRDAAIAEETDSLRKRDFLGATRIRERANLQIEQENKALVDAANEKLMLQKQEDAAQLRELDKARRDRMTALQRANDEAKIAYQRDLSNQRDARKIAEREAAINRNRELRAANEDAQRLLGIKRQQAQAELNIASQVLAGIKNMGNNTTVNNNNSRTNNGGVNITNNNGSPAATEQAILQVLGRVGLV